MSFTGIFKAGDGLVAIADSKASKKENGTFSEDIGRNPQKLFPFMNGVAVISGTNRILVQNPNELFSKKVFLETLIQEHLEKYQTLNPDFFQTLLIKFGTNPSNKEPVDFLIGRKIRSGEYRLEHHRIGYNYYAERIGGEHDFYFTGGNDLYRLAFEQMDYLSHATSADVLQKFLASKLRDFITFYDETLSYNSVGGDVKSYILR